MEIPTLTVPPKWRRYLGKGLWFRLLMTAILAIVTALAFHDVDTLEANLEVGDIWQQEALVAPVSFPIYKSADTLRAQRMRVRYDTEPIFADVSDQARDQMIANRDTVGKQLDDVVAAYHAYVVQARRDSVAAGTDAPEVILSTEAVRDSLRYMALRQRALVKLSEQQWQQMGWEYARQSPDYSRTPEFVELRYEIMLDLVYDVGERLRADGVLDIPRDSVHTPAIIVTNETTGTFRKVSTSRVFGINLAHEVIRQTLEDSFRDNGFEAAVYGQVIQAILVPSLEFDRIATARSWNAAERRIAEVRDMVARGDTIVVNGQPISPLIKQQLLSLQRVRPDMRTREQRWLRTAGKMMVSLLTLGVFTLYLSLARPSIARSARLVLLLGLLYCAAVALFAVAVRQDPDLVYAVPVVVISVLLAVIFDSRIALFGTLALALLGGLVQDFEFKYTYATLIGGICAVFSVRGMRTRTQLFLSAGAALVGYAVALTAAWMFEGGSGELLRERLAYIGLHSVLITLAFPLLWVLERLFDLTTDVRLLELSDTNRPLLKELATHASGTFNHSFQVANLAESVAAAIGANALLTRVGALYHDVGKLAQASYFIENQRGETNPHDALSIRESASLITAHVRNGLRLGRRYRLPRRIMDFIASHHGTTRTEYFYRRAMEAAQKDGSAVDEAAFQYPGPRPQSREEGVLMLTDGVEAAARSMNRPVRGNPAQSGRKPDPAARRIRSAGRLGPDLRRRGAHQGGARHQATGRTPRTSPVPETQAGQLNALSTGRSAMVWSPGRAARINGMALKRAATVAVSPKMPPSTTISTGGSPSTVTRSSDLGAPTYMRRSRLTTVWPFRLADAVCRIPATRPGSTFR